MLDGSETQKIFYVDRRLHFYQSNFMILEFRKRL